jgi:hypothetical protein
MAKNFSCTSKGIVIRTTKQHTEWEKTFTLSPISYSTDKGLISRIYKELKNINGRTNNAINKGQMN